MQDDKTELKLLSRDEVDDNNNMTMMMMAQHANATRDV
jgi:hypothetical protein